MHGDVYQCLGSQGIPGSQGTPDTMQAAFELNLRMQTILKKQGHPMTALVPHHVQGIRMAKVLLRLLEPMQSLLHRGGTLLYLVNTRSAIG